jgi:hypothetical protein
VLEMPSGIKYFGPSYVSPVQITGTEEGTCILPSCESRP